MDGMAGLAGGAALPLLLLGLPLLGALLAWVLPAAGRRAAWIGSCALALLLAAAQAAQVVRAGPIPALGGELLVDGLGALLSLLIAFIAFACSLYAAAYLPGPHAADPERRATLERRLPLFQALFLVLETTLLWVVLTNNIVLLWVALEATTLASALLVSFYGDPRALEAGYKYLLLLTVGITSAFFGCVLLYSAAQPHLGSASALLISNLGRVAADIPPHIALIATLLLLIGFGTKAGLAPFHPWVADAHAEAPAVMSAFLSSVIIKVPFVGLLRVWSVFGPRYPELNETLMALGAFTLVVGGALAVAQDDLKRLFAYSSVAQVGFIAVALGTGHEFGTYAAVFFLVSHALTKALLFLGAGAVAFAARDLRSLAALGGLGRRLPLTFGCTLAGLLSLAGFPPFSGFAAKAGVVLAAAATRAWPVVAVSLGASLLTMVYGIGVAQRVFLGAPRTPGLESTREVPLPMGLAMLLLAAATLLLGLQPQLLDPLLRLAAHPGGMP
jgi:hydrogenase-4 component F